MRSKNREVVVVFDRIGRALSSQAPDPCLPVNAGSAKGRLDAQEPSAVRK